MNLNFDFSQRVVIEADTLTWSPGPSNGIEQKILEQDGAETARTTSIVRYAAGTSFANQGHDLGVEIFVLEGIFSDKSGDYGSGSYIKNASGSMHASRSAEGCTLFVKRGHLSVRDRQSVVVDTLKANWHPGLVPGLAVMPLSNFETQNTALVRWSPETYFSAHRHYGGEEILVISGIFEDEHGRYPQGTWIRSPHLSLHQPYSKEGCTILVKTGHLPF